MKDFQDKVAVVTGAASGIGRALAGKCAQEGMKVVLADVEESALWQAEYELQVSGAQVLAVRTDVSQDDEVEALAKITFETYGAVHLLFNNAGVGAGTTVWESSLADWQWVLGVNLWGVIHSIHFFVPRMLTQDSEGHIVNTASSAGLVSSSSLGMYKVSKHGVVTLSETLALELAAHGAKLKASVLCPEFVNTRIFDAERNRPQALQNAPQEQDTSPEMEALHQAARQWLAQVGLPPPQVAEMVFDAIRQEKFYILTHPATKYGVQLRMEDILQERMPTDIFLSPPVVSQFRRHTHLKKEATQQEEGQHPMELPQIVSTYIDAFCRQDLDTCLATFAPDGTYSDPVTAQPLSGQAIKDYFGRVFAGFTDATIETVAAHAITEDLVVWRWVIRGTNTGSNLGSLPTGRSLILPGCEFIEVRAAKVQRIEGYFDRLSILEQLGLVPGPPAGAVS